MLNFLFSKIAISVANYLTRMHCILVERDKKVHHDYDVIGIAKVSAIQKVELERDSEEVFYVNERTKLITKRFNSGYYAKHGLLVKDTCDMVDLESFRARVTLANGEERVLNREEYIAYIGYRQDQARIVYPDGSVNTDKAFVQSVLEGKCKPDSYYTSPKTVEEQECAKDESFALPV